MPTFKASDFDEIYELVFSINPGSLRDKEFEYLIDLREKCLSIKRTILNG